MIASFIIPHKGRENLLIETINSIIEQTIEQDEIEIIVVTQNKLLSFTDEFISQHDNFQVHHIEEHETISFLRNFGALNANGQYLVFLDADIKLDKNWLEQMLITINELKSRIIVSSVQRVSSKPTEVELVRTALNFINKDSNVDTLAGSNLFMRKEDFMNSSKFPLHMKTCEDIYFTSEMKSVGDLFITSRTKHVHLGEDKSYLQLFRKEIWRGQSNLQSIKGRHIPLREIPSFVLPIGLLILVLITIATLLNNQPWAAAISILLLSIPFVLYSVRLYLLANKQIPFKYILKFYMVYFPARAIGTIGGLFKSFSNSGIK
jgi:glycosyltransferase involved in cell wall biosynthesis